MRYGWRHPASVFPNIFLGAERPLLLAYKDAYRVDNPVYHGCFGVYRRDHTGAQIQPLTLPEPQPTEKIEVGTRGHSENRPESPLDPDFHPVVTKIAKIHFWGRFGAKKVSEWAPRVAGWDPRDLQKSSWKKYFR